MTSKTFSNCGTESHSKSNEGQTIGQGAIRRHSEHPSILKPFTGCSINSTPLAIAALRMASHPQEVTWCPPCQSKAPCTSSSLQKKNNGFWAIQHRNLHSSHDNSFHLPQDAACSSAQGSKYPSLLSPKDPRATPSVQSQGNLQRFQTQPFRDY